MTYIVTEDCIKCKYTDCVTVCPVDCFYEGQNMLVIDPEQCIDCAVCVSECPAEAIIHDSQPGAEKWVEMNKTYARIWPNITHSKDPPQDADRWLGISHKFEKYFSPRPGAKEEQ